MKIETMKFPEEETAARNVLGVLKFVQIMMILWKFGNSVIE
jgi:hypothetical protein